MHEREAHERACFLTLTYDDDHLPEHGHLNKRDLQLFLKRLRKNTGERLRYFACGEYGENFGRPHFHLALFGQDFRRDAYAIRTQDGTPMWGHELVDATWRNGFAPMGELTFESAAYIARYCTKKITGQAAEQHYQGRPREFATMSLKPAIGADWIDQWHADVYPSDQVIVRGKPCKPPRYYDARRARNDPEQIEAVKQAREEKAKQRPEEQTKQRRRVRETCATARMKQRH